MDLDWPMLLAIVLGALALSGAFCLVFIFWFWEEIGALIPESWPKLVVETVQTSSAIASIGAAFASATDEKGQWFAPAIAGCISLLVWKILQILIDHRIKAWEKAERSAFKKLEQESESRTRLLTLFREFVIQKVRRLAKGMKQGASHRKKMSIHSTLAPESHLDEILLSITGYFSGTPVE